MKIKRESVSKYFFLISPLHSSFYVKKKHLQQIVFFTYLCKVIIISLNYNLVKLIL